MSTTPSIHEFVESHPEIKTPYFLLDETRLLKNMEKIDYVRKQSGAKAVLALKCFSSWSVFPLMSKYMDGTTSSGFYEAKLGHEKFGGETQGYSVSWSDDDINELVTFADKIIFNSLSQFNRFYDKVKGKNIGMRVNPGVSYSHFDLSDPARKQSRLGEKSLEKLLAISDKIQGVMFHVNCENSDLEAFSNILDTIGTKFAPLLQKMEWVSLGGGIAFTNEDYPRDKFAARLKKFAEEFGVQVYLEPGDAAVTMAGFLVTQVRDIIENEGTIAVVNTSLQSHMPDNLIYREPTTIDLPAKGPFQYTVAGATCLAGDVFGTYEFPRELKIGDYVVFDNAARYTIIQMNWFNGIQMPSIVVKRLDGTVDVVREFTYDDFRNSLS
jgi:carboxynorspermidine decarboxylase